jgi:hypothetical protein
MHTEVLRRLQDDGVRFNIAERTGSTLVDTLTVLVLVIVESKNLN